MSDFKSYNLIKKAAAYIGYEVVLAISPMSRGIMVERVRDGLHMQWNPLEDDATAFKLATDVRASITYTGDHHGIVTCMGTFKDQSVSTMRTYTTDEEVSSATRYAIVELVALLHDAKTNAEAEQDVQKNILSAIEKIPLNAGRFLVARDHCQSRWWTLCTPDGGEIRELNEYENAHINSAIIATWIASKECCLKNTAPQHNQDNITIALNAIESIRRFAAEWGGWPGNEMACATAIAALTREIQSDAV